MNKLDFLQTGGFPLIDERLDDMQEAYSIFNALGYLGGDKTIIYGCEVQGANTSDGYVFYNGEVLPFKSGATMATVKIIEEVTSDEFENGQVKPVHRKRYVTFASGSNTIQWADFTRLNPLKEMQRRILPPGTNPQLYCGAANAIPAGWQLCDGTNGTEDLRGRFIVGYHPTDADYNAIGNTGGAKTVALTAAQNGQHGHTASAAVDGSHKHVGLKVKGSSRDNGDPGDFIITANAEPNGNQTNAGETEMAGAHSHIITVGESGEGQAHENRPPYYTLAYIIYIG